MSNWKPWALPLLGGLAGGLVPALLLWAVIGVPKPNPPLPPEDLIVNLPGDLQAQVGRMTKLSADSKGSVTWVLPPDTLAKLDIHPEGRSVIVCPASAGIYWVGVTAVSKGLAVEPVWCRVMANGPGPGPGPKPPDPPAPPVPPTPIPAAGLRVLIIEDQAQRNKLPPAQLAVLQSQEIRQYLAARAARGPDGVTPEYRFFDAAADVSKESALWQEAFKRPRTSLPWIIVSDGKTGVEQALPSTVQDTLNLLKKFGG